MKVNKRKLEIDEITIGEVLPYFKRTLKIINELRDYRRVYGY